MNLVDAVRIVLIGLLLGAAAFALLLLVTRHRDRGRGYTVGYVWRDGKTRVTTRRVR